MVREKKKYTAQEMKARKERRQEQHHRAQKKYLGSKWQPKTTCPASWQAACEMAANAAGCAGISEYIRLLIIQDLQQRGLLDVD